MKEAPAQADRQALIERLFSVGFHFGYSRSRRDPSVKPYIFGVKNRVEIFDLEKTSELLLAAREYVTELARAGKTILFVGGKHEAFEAVRAAAKTLNQPYSSPRWIGGTLSNFGNIRKRVERLVTLEQEREDGTLAHKYTKKEQLLLSREIDRLRDKFEGIVSMEKKPDALFIVDPKRDHIALTEAQKARIPVIALLNSDCNTRGIQYPIVGNDANLGSISLVMNEIIAAYQEGARTRTAPPPPAA